MNRNLIGVGHLLEHGEGVEPLSVKREPSMPTSLSRRMRSEFERRRAATVKASGERNFVIENVGRWRFGLRFFPRVFGFRFRRLLFRRLLFRDVVFVVEVIVAGIGVCAVAVCAHSCWACALAAFSFANASVNAAGRGIHLTISKCSSRLSPCRL